MQSKKATFRDKKVAKSRSTINAFKILKNHEKICEHIFYSFFSLATFCVSILGLTND